MPVAEAYTNPTGFQNLLSSFNEWLFLNVPPGSQFTYNFMADAGTTDFPSVEVVGPIDNVEPGANAYGELVFPAGAQEQGRPNVVTIEINIYTDSRKDKSAKKTAFQIRDRIARGLANAGLSNDDDGTVILPPIKVLDYDNSAADTGIVARVQTRSASGLGSRYFPPSADASTVHKIQMLARVEWYELV